MKKIITSLVILAAAVSLTACGGKEQSVTYTMESDLNGVIMTDTMVLDAKGDRVQQMTEIVELDMAEVDTTTQSLLVEQYDAIVETYNSVEGVECTSETGEGTYSITTVSYTHLETRGAFTVVEYLRDLSVSPSSTLTSLLSVNFLI